MILMFSRIITQISAPGKIAALIHGVEGIFQLLQRHSLSDCSCFKADSKKNQKCAFGHKGSSYTTTAVHWSHLLEILVKCQRKGVVRSEIASLWYIVEQVSLSVQI